jgi:hypothetical protein
MRDERGYDILGMLRSSSVLPLLNGEPQGGLVSRMPKFSENPDAMISGLDAGKLLKLPYDLGRPSARGTSSYWEPM